MKYTTETRLYSKNNEDVIAYFDEIKEQYNYILRKVYYIIRNDPKLKTNLLNTELQSKYSISRRTANSIIKTVQGKINSIKALKETAYRFGSGNKTKNDLLLIINKLAELAIRTGKDLVVEDLNFLKKKSKTMQGKSEKGKRYNKTLHSLAYRTFLDRAEQICNRENVGLIKVNPAWTSWIAKNKFCDKMKLNVHTGAAFVIARRGMNIKDVV